jgi:hypothetical protein
MQNGKISTQYEAKDLNGSIVIPRWIIPFMAIVIGAFVSIAIWGLNIMITVQQDISVLKSDNKRMEQFFIKVDAHEKKLLELEYKK